MILRSSSVHPSIILRFFEYKWEKQGVNSGHWQQWYCRGVNIQQPRKCPYKNATVQHRYIYVLTYFLHGNTRVTPGILLYTLKYRHLLSLSCILILES